MTFGVVPELGWEFSRLKPAIIPTRTTTIIVTARIVWVFFLIIKRSFLPTELSSTELIKFSRFFNKQAAPETSLLEKPSINRT